MKTKSMKARILTTVSLLGALALASGQTIPNPSFESNSFAVWPGYISGNSPIVGWTSGDTNRAGLNPVSGSWLMCIMWTRRRVHARRAKSNFYQFGGIKAHEQSSHGSRNVGACSGHAPRATCHRRPTRLIGARRFPRGRGKLAAGSSASSFPDLPAFENGSVT